MEKEREKETLNTVLQQLGPAEILRTNGRRLPRSRKDINVETQETH